jgi:hypothetical protein
VAVNDLTVQLKEHFEAFLRGHSKFMEERDRRYTEVGIEREKALKIKETADLAALQLARDIQSYKDEKANELREQISSERGHYASRDDLDAAVKTINATLAPLIGSNREGARVTMANLVVAVTLALAAGGFVVSYVRQSPTPSPSLIPGPIGSQTTPAPQQK